MAPTRITLTLSPDEAELFKRLQAFTGLSAAQSIAKLLPSHLNELWEYLTWLEQLPKEASRRRAVGVGLIQNYGPKDLIQSIKELDPTYLTEGERLVKEVQQSDPERTAKEIGL